MKIWMLLSFEYYELKLNRSPRWVDVNLKLCGAESHQKSIIIAVSIEIAEFQFSFAFGICSLINGETKIPFNTYSLAKINAWFQNEK